MHMECLQRCNYCGNFGCCKMKPHTGRHVCQSCLERIHRNREDGNRQTQLPEAIVTTSATATQELVRQLQNVQPVHPLSWGTTWVENELAYRPCSQGILADALQPQATSDHNVPTKLRDVIPCHKLLAGQLHFFQDQESGDMYAVYGTQRPARGSMLQHITKTTNNNIQKLTLLPIAAKQLKETRRTHTRTRTHTHTHIYLLIRPSSP